MIVSTQNMTYLFHGIAEIIIAKLICIKLIDNEYTCKSQNDINLKKTLITYNINKCFEIIMKSNITFTISNKKKIIQLDEQKNNKNWLLKNNVKLLI